MPRLSANRVSSLRGSYSCERHGRCWDRARSIRLVSSSMRQTGTARALNGRQLWRVASGVLSGCPVGSVVSVTLAGDVVQIATPDGRVVATLDAKGTKWRTTLRRDTVLRNKAAAVEVTLTPYDAAPGRPSPAFGGGRSRSRPSAAHQVWGHDPPPPRRVLQGEVNYANDTLRRRHGFPSPRPVTMAHSCDAGRVQTRSVNGRHRDGGRRLHPVLDVERGHLNGAPVPSTRCGDQDSARALLVWFCGHARHRGPLPRREPVWIAQQPVPVAEPSRV
jgi:hypothetical protein